MLMRKNKTLPARSLDECLASVDASTACLLIQFYNSMNLIQRAKFKILMERYIKHGK